MAFQLLLNFFLAFLWMFLQDSLTLPSFVIGFFIGLILIMVMMRFFATRFYLWRVVAVVKLTIIFLWELVKANIQVIGIVLKPKLDMKPGIFRYDTELTHDWDIALLSMMITLTPGTVIIDVSDDNRTLYVHTIHVPDAKAAVDSIRNTFEKAIMEVEL
ncbi:Na+/H+ antiporter subunit E [Jeotgalibacillus soli]|uniref:Cation:proton antiporter n=1 Tax=Jeotgalibacillus soli TaxID=889306 RepID=A0A0C2VDH4_9BACL|nr:Na+/H+ antiporter subunit E [Jeotgalibacillus soli]KIL42601.1 cation:proton antiporter [Jeotgalibacillus soli]